MILLVGLYLDPDPARCREFMECIQRNTANASIEQVCIFFEEPEGFDRLLASFPELASPKVKLVHFGRRLTCHDLFAYANLHLPGKRVIVANADIFFDDTLALLDGHDLAGRLLCLSRWDVGADGEVSFFEHSMSQDVWIFATPIRDFPCNFHLGVPGCDNRIAWEAELAGLQLLNPGRSIRANHLHLSQIRRYSESQRLLGHVSDVYATSIEEMSFSAIACETECGPPIKEN